MTNFTKFPNWLIDDVMPDCSPTEWKFITAVVRMTNGYKGREWWQMSVNDLASLTGMNRRTIIRILDKLPECIKQQRSGNSYEYSVNGDTMSPIDSDRKSPFDNEVVTESHQASDRKSPKTVTESHQPSDRKSPKYTSLKKDIKKKESSKERNAADGVTTLLPSSSAFDDSHPLLKPFMDIAMILAPPHPTPTNYENDWLAPLEAIWLASGKDLERATEAMRQAAQGSFDNGYSVPKPKSLRAKSVQLLKKKPEPKKKKLDITYDRSAF